MNKNMLSRLGFSFNIKKLPEFNFFVQSVTLPGISMGSIDQPTPFKNINFPGDRITYGDLTVNFKINEDLGNYIEIFNWITSLGFPESFDQYRDIATESKKITGDGIYSDGYLMIMSSNMQPIIRVDIQDLFPTSLTDIEMDSRDTSLEYIEATVTFKFLNYKFTPI